MTLREACFQNLRERVDPYTVSLLLAGSAENYVLQGRGEVVYAGQTEEIKYVEQVTVTPEPSGDFEACVRSAEQPTLKNQRKGCTKLAQDSRVYPMLKKSGKAVARRSLEPRQDLQRRVRYWFGHILGQKRLRDI